MMREIIDAHGHITGSMLLDPMAENVLDTLQHAAEELHLRALKF
jgi:hypothetical protein